MTKTQKRDETVPQQVDDSIYADPDMNINDHGSSVRLEDTNDHPEGASNATPRSTANVSGGRSGGRTVASGKAQEAKQGS